MAEFAAETKVTLDPIKVGEVMPKAKRQSCELFGR